MALYRSVMKIAALTMVFNERHLLPIWVHHYGSAIGRENLYVVDDGSDDGSTSGLGDVKVMRRSRGLLDENKRVNMIGGIQAELLTRHDASYALRVICVVCSLVWSLQDSRPSVRGCRDAAPRHDQLSQDRCDAGDSPRSPLRHQGVPLTQVLP